MDSFIERKQDKEEMERETGSGLSVVSLTRLDQVHSSLVIPKGSERMRMLVNINIFLLTKVGGARNK